MEENYIKQMQGEEPGNIRRGRRKKAKAKAPKKAPETPKPEPPKQKPPKQEETDKHNKLACPRCGERTIVTDQQAWNDICEKPVLSRKRKCVECGHKAVSTESYVEKS